MKPFSLYRRQVGCRILGFFCAFAAFSLPLSAGELKVDINRDGKNTSTQTATGYTQWTTNATSGGTSSVGTAAITQSFTTSTSEAVTVSLAMTAASQSALGTGITYTYYQAGTTTIGQKLVSDGVTVAPAIANAGGQIQMTITGLAAGPHSLLTYHNAGDSATALISMAPIKIYLNGTYATTITPSIRSTDSTTPIAYLEFSTIATTDVTTVLFAADTASTATTKNVVLNGFEIDTPNSTRIANTPSPADADEHVDADALSATLSWVSATAGTAVSHDVYFGTNLAAIKTATHASATFLGNQIANSRSVPVTDPHAIYYWRVDEIDSLGNATAGTVWYFRPRHLAFPGAEGFGRFARGGRGGKVVHITSLADYATADTPIPGTLRYAVEVETGPRVVVFDVGGMITVDHRLTLAAPYVTIAGQTAPGKGICLRQWPLGLSGAKDAVIRFIRNRPGNISGQTIDGGGLAGCDHSIMDHSSISWSIDEGFSSRSAKNITLQNTLISESLAIAGHQNYSPGTDHGYAATISGDKGSFHFNLLAHNSGRNWSLGGGLDASGTTFAGRLDITNNVVYNWRSRTTDGGAMEVNFVNNYYKPGAATTLVPYALTMNHEDNFAGTQRAYFAGNIMQGYFTEANQTVGRRSVVSSGITVSYETFVATPFFTPFVTTLTATGAYKRVLSDVGANRPLDDHDIRVINETRTGTYTYTGTGPYGGYPGLPNSQTDVGGWENYGNEVRPSGWDTDNDGMPNWWETLKFLNPNSPSGDYTECNADPDGNGYTNLEDYLNWMAAPNVDCAGTVDVDLGNLTRGYTTSPGFTLTSPVNGTVAIVNTNKARFTPANSSSAALGSFTYTVTDSAGDSMTQTIGVRILGAAVPAVVTIAATDATAGESGDQALGFTVTRTGATTAALTVPLVASGTASSGSDYSGFVSSVAIPIGQVSVALPLTVLPDALSEGSETITIALGASADFTAGSPASASATIDDLPSQAFYFNNIADPAKRGPIDDADSDSQVNIIEYFMGSQPDNSGSYGTVTIPSVGTGTFKIRFPRAKNRPDVSGSLRWSPNMTNWLSSGQSDGAHTVSFTEAVVSAPAADPETVEATAIITGSGDVPTIFVRLGVQ